MRLLELDPHWMKGYFDGPERHGMGITFDCPHCPAGKRTRLGVAFVNPVDGGAPMPLDPTGKNGWRFLWRRTGDTFETLTLTPSIDASAQGHWHGFISNGDVS